MHNIAQRIDGSKLILEIELSAKTLKLAKPSSTGKTWLLATMHGNISLPPIDGCAAAFSLNVTVRKN